MALEHRKIKLAELLHTYRRLRPSVRRSYIFCFCFLFLFCIPETIPFSSGIKLLFLSSIVSISTVEIWIDWSLFSTSLRLKPFDGDFFLLWCLSKFDSWEERFTIRVLLVASRDDFRATGERNGKDANVPFDFNSGANAFGVDCSPSAPNKWLFLELCSAVFWRKWEDDDEIAEVTLDRRFFNKKEWRECFFSVAVEW